MKTFLLRYMLILLTLTSVSAQQTAVLTNELAPFNKAVDLYNNEQYYAAQVQFREIQTHNSSKNIKADCSYYIVSCAIRLNHSNAELLMEEYLDIYPESSNNSQMYLDAAFYFFDGGNYLKSLKWFEKVEPSSVNSGDRNKFNFGFGYSYFKGKQTDLAEEYLKKTEGTKDYGIHSTYYLGFIAYQKGEFKRAKTYLETLVEDENYAVKVNYLLADIYFNLKKFDLAIKYAEKQLESAKRSEKVELSKIIGESYFNLKKYKEAIPYLEGYRVKSNKWLPVDYYQLGYAYYKTEDYEKAISQFNKIITEESAITQNAYYHLGESYLKLDKKTEAFNAFKHASEMNFEPELQEDAYYNYAKLSYEIGNPYESTPAVLQGFLDKYPKTTNRPEIKKLIISSFVISKDYKEAIRLLEKDKVISLPDVYQKAAFLLGEEAFYNEEYPIAITYFEKSLKTPVNSTFVSKALFWKAEAEYLLNQYKTAIISYKQFVENESSSEAPEFANVYYNIGYTYFKQKDYIQAALYFDKYIASKPEDKERLNDAYLRLGDSHYVSLKYWPAAEAYNKAIGLKSSTSDYAYYQKALCYGYIEKTDQKIENLKKFPELYPKSKYLDDVIFELANTYSITNQNDKALATYQDLITSQQESVYVSKSLLRQALIYYNDDKGSKALEKLEKVVADFPATSESIEAVATAKIIYVDMGEIEKYAAWVKDLDFIEVTDEELDNLTFESAEKQYLQNNVASAKENLATYIQNYPKGFHSLKANFYLAQLLYAEGLEEESIPYFEYVLGVPINEYAEESLAKLSRVLLRKKDYITAIPVLERLEKESRSPQDLVFAISNLMKAYYETEKYAEAVVYAEKVMETKDSDQTAKDDSQIIIARSAMKTGDEDKAKKTYSKLADATGELGAEVLYYKAFFENKSGEYEASNNTIQELARDFAGYKYYGAKGLLVMADNFDKLDDAFQATYVLETVITNFEDYPEVVEAAAVQLEDMKEAEESLDTDEIVDEESTEDDEFDDEFFESIEE